MRLMTRRAAGLDPGEWDASALEEVTNVFDALAPEWHTRTSSERTEVVADALRRGLDEVGRERGLAIEAGAGIGTYSTMLSSRFRSVLSLDLSFEMIARSSAPLAHRIVADASRLPVGDETADGLILINAFVFPEEVKRVLRRGGTIVWVNSSGDQYSYPSFDRRPGEGASFPGTGCRKHGWGWLVVCPDSSRRFYHGSLVVRGAEFLTPPYDWAHRYSELLPRSRRNPFRDQ